jgi:tripartite-type tricarboxylate transporter receptor subunit TctC
VAGKTVRWIVSSSPGGGYDLYSRLIEPFYEAKIGAEIVVENIPGAGGLIGTKTLKEAKPDGLTLGILDVAGLLGALLSGEPDIPNPTKDFTILGRVSRSQHVWATSTSSPFQTMQEVLAAPAKRGILFGITEVGGTSFVSISITAFLLGIQPQFITGFSGGRESSLAAVRGEIDFVVLSFESIRDRIEAGDLKPLLQISAERIAPHPALEGVPLLSGDSGLAVQRAKELGRDPEEAKRDARALVSLIDTGRVIAAPAGLEENLFSCLEKALYEVLTDPAFEAVIQKAKRTLDVGRADVARADLQAVAERAEKFTPLIREALKKVRQ